MHKNFRTWTGMAAAVLGGVLIVGAVPLACGQSQAAQPAAQSEKKPKDQGEYDIINEVNKDLASTTPNFQKTITDLNAWMQKYPESDWRDDRLYYYLLSYSNQAQANPGCADCAAKVLEYASQLLSKDLNAAFKDKTLVLNILARTASSIQSPTLKDPTPDQLATGEKAAKALQDFVANWAANKPAGMADAQWEAAKPQIAGIATATLNYVVMMPGEKAAAAKDYPGAEAAFKKALETNPDNGLLAYRLGATMIQAQAGQQQKDLAKYSQALYFIARAVAMDPAKSGIAAAERTRIETYLKTAYTGYHGSDEGLEQLKQQALASAIPPADFKLKTSAEVAGEKEAAFREKYPEVAKWMSIKGVLSADNGVEFFANQMKDTQVTGLKGVVMGGTPECNPKEILVAIPDPEGKSTLTSEITLKFETPLKGKPVEKSEINFGGVPSAFSKEPFMLTMTVDKDSMPTIQTDPCTPAKAAPKGGKAKGKAPAKGKK